MKKLTKSAKIILVSVISAVCVLAIVLGAIFATRGKNPNDPNNPNNPVEKPLTWAEKVDLLGKEINEANNTTSYDIVLGVPYEGYVDDDHILSEIGKNYFVISLDEMDTNKLFYFYTTKSDGSFDVINLTSKKSDGGCGEDDATNFSVKSYNEKYVVLECSGSEYDYVFSVIDISGTSPKIIYTYKTTEIENKVQSIYDSVKISSDNKTIFFSLRIYEVDDENSSERFNITYYLVNLQNKQLFELDTYGYDDGTEIYYSFQNNSVAINFNGTVRIYVVTNRLYTHLVSAPEGYKYSTYYHLYDKQFLIEYYKQETKSTLSDNSVIDDNTGNMGNYKYQLLSLENSRNELLCSDYSLDEKIARLEIKKYSSFYSILEKKVDSEHKYSGENKITYYYKDGDLVATYDYKSKSGDVVYVENSTFVTKAGIFKINSKTEFDVVYEFDDNHVLITEKFKRGYIPVCVIESGNEEIAFLDNDGNLILKVADLISPFTDTNFDYQGIKRFVINNEAYLFYLQNGILRVNFEKKTLDIFETNIDDSILNALILKEYDFYFYQNEESLSLRDFSGNILINDIKDYRFIDSLNYGIIVEIENLGQKYSINLYGISLKDLYEEIDSLNNVNNYSLNVSPYDIHNQAGAVYKVYGYSTDKDSGWSGWTWWECTRWGTVYIAWHTAKYNLVSYNDVLGESNSKWPSGYDFIGWTTESDGVSVTHTAGTTVTSSTGETASGPFYPIFRHNVNVHILNGTTVTKYEYPQDCNYFSSTYTNVDVIYYRSTRYHPATPNIIAGNGWNFMGLTTGNNYNSNYQSNNRTNIGSNGSISYSTYKINSNLTDLYGIYRKEIKTSYNTNDSTYGSVEDKNLYIYGNTSGSFGRFYLSDFDNGLASGSTISKIGYYFNGWIYNNVVYDASSYKWCPYSNFSNTTKSFTFYASWIAAKINLQFIFCQSINNNLKVVSDGVISSSSDTLKDLGVKAMENNSYFTYSNIKYNNYYYLGYRGDKTDRYNYVLPYYQNGSIISNQSITFSNLNLSNILAEIPSELITYRTTCLKNDYKTITQEISGWAFGPTHADKFDYLYSFKDNNKKLVGYSSKESSDLKLLEYLKIQLAPTENESWSKEWHDNYRYSYQHMTIPFYAYFEPRPYYVYTEVEEVNGASFDKGNEFYEYANDDSNDNSTRVTYDFTRNKTGDFGVNSTGYDIGLGTDLTLKISLTQPSGAAGIIYTIGRIELKNYPYKYGSGYKTMTAIFYVNFSSDSAGTITSNLTGNSTTGFYDSSSSDTNIVKFTEVSPGSIIITIKNVGLASDIKGKNPTSGSVGSTGQQGFTIKAYAVAGYTNNNGSSSFVDTISVSGEYNGYNAVNNKNNPYGFTVVRLYSEGSYKYFWINSRKYYIDSNQLKNNTVLNSTDVKVKNGSSLESSYIKTPYNQVENKVECNIVVNGDYAFIISENAINGAKYVVPNYGSSEFYAIEPKQGFLNQVDSEGKVFTEIYELQSYISKIILPGGVELSFDKPVKFNESNGYNKTINSILKNENLNTHTAFNKKPFNDSGSTTDFTNYGCFEYLGTDYYIIDMNKYNGRTNYHLYLGIDKDTGKYMYFLVGQNVNEKTKLTEAYTIEITFSNIESTISIKTEGIKDDSYTNQDTNGLNIKYNNYASSEQQTNIDAIYDSITYDENISKVFPTDAYVFRFTPISGYLINEITVKIDQYTVLYFTLNKKDGIGGDFKGSGSGDFSYYVSERTGTVTSNIVQIPYTGKYNPFNTNNVASLGTYNSGIYYKGSYDDGYKTSTTTTNRFESFDLFVSGIYDNVEITVTTISFFEMAFYENDEKNSLFDMEKTKSIDQLGKLQIAYYKNQNWIKLSESDISNEKKSISVKNDSGSHVYRVLFFGLASEFKNGIAFHASGEDYSYSFSNGRYYAGLKNDKGENNPLSYINANSLKNYGVDDGGNINDSTSYLYISTGSLEPFFNASEKFSAEYTIASNYKSDDGYKKDLIIKYKYVITFKVSKQTNSITSKSWLATTNSNTYQVDNPTTKTNTWFNDTTVTNIDFTNNLLKNSNDTTGTETSKNWQDVSSNGQYIVDKNFGYGISFRYYTVPGYYINAFSIKATSTGAKSLFSGTFNEEYKDKEGNVITLGTSSNDTIAYGIFETALPREIGSKNIHKQKISYKLSYNVDENEGAYYDIQLFVNDDEGNDFETVIKNLGILASDIEIDIYSIQYEIIITYNSNTGDSSSAGETFSFNKSGENSKDSTTDTLKYDREATLSLSPSMVGYTFIGWGGGTIYSNEEFVEDKERYNEDSNTWDSSSAWTDICDYFSKDMREKLVKLRELTKVDKDFRCASDFYILNGKFMTDTGFAKDTSVRNGEKQRQQEYNFWAAYNWDFTKDINVENVDVNNAKFKINLYAIWKVNTYMVTFDMNDEKTRGETTTYVSGYNNNVLGKFETISSSIILPSIKYKEGNYIKYSNERLNAYITFDTSDWYVLVDSSTNDSNFNELPYSKSTRPTVKKVKLSDYVIDRYGYTWLGWFSQKLDRVFESQSYYQEDSRRATYPIIQDKTEDSGGAFVYGTEAYTTKVSDKNNGEFAELNYACIVNLFKYNAQNTNSNVKEIEKSTRFLYKNLYKDDSFDDDDDKLNTSLDYIYFYDYQGKNDVTVNGRNYNYARDYLNDLQSDNYNSLTEKSKTDGVPNQILMYYDTMLDYRYYNFSTKGTSGDSTKNEHFGYVSAEISGTYSSYRYLTLYAYWQTNSYQVNVDFRDSESESSTTGIKFGSTAVDKSEKSFMPVYFDDQNFEVQLSRFLPIRLGYDFIGWSFGPDTDSGDHFTVAASYVFGGTLSQRLYSKNNLKLKELITENREQLGDRESNNVDEKRAIYIFAVWRAQTYSINVSLNISASKLKNLYDIDSEFAIALYKTTENQGNIISFDNYLGINSNYLLNKSSANLSETAFGEIVANLVFEITFDQSIEDATLKNFKDNYTIKKLFTTSAGYYLLGWMSGDIVLVSNTTKSTFAEDGSVVSGTGNTIFGDSIFALRKVKGTFADGIYQYANDILYTNLDATLFNELVSSYYTPTYDYNSKKLTLNYTLNSSGDETGTALGSGSIDEYHTQKLNTLDYYDRSSQKVGRYQIYDEISGSNYYTTIKKSSNASSNFGYITEGGLNYYICVEKNGDNYVMYYIDASDESQKATKWYLYPYVQLVNSKNEMQYYAANRGSEVKFKYDGTNFYIDNYLVRFCNFNTNTKYGTDSMEPNAYYTSSTFDNAVAVKILFKKSKVLTETITINDTGISFGKDDSGSDIYSLDIEEYTLTKTREFTIYAQWAQKEDLNVTINNGNNSINGGQTADNNYGLAGYYRIKDSSDNAESRTNSFEDQRATESSNTNSSVSRNFEFYDKLDMFIAPYFNGRFLSEISFKFYSYEDVGPSSSGSELYETNYKKIPYVLTLKFEWNSTNHMIELSKVTIKKGTNNENDVTYLSAEFGGDGYLGNTIKVKTDRLTQIGKSNDLAKLSLLSRDVMYDKENSSGTLLKVSDYIGKVIDYNKVNNFNELSSEDTGRIDINYILMNFANVMTSMDITCKFSVQTYKLEIYNVFDTAGNNLESVTGTTNYRSTNYASLTDMLVNTKSVFGSSEPYTYEGSLAETVDRETMSKIQGGVIRVATISRDCATNSTSYDVPYGTYIYGNYYNQQIRPVDEDYDPVKRTGYDKSDYTGYNYIFQEGYYNYGNSQTKIKPQESDGVIDTYGRQCYTILGSKTLFSNSVREPSALYTFVSWFMPTTASDGGDSLEFAQYSKDWEATAFRQNLCLVGYYYANNKPTSINFYTWNDNENAYEQYTNNITEYTLQSTETKYAFKEENSTTHELVRDKNITPYIDSTDEENRMILFFRTSFGVDATKFENEDAYSTKEIRPASKDFLRNNLIRNYWFYKNYSTLIYFDDNGTHRYICYDESDTSLTHYYYTTASGKKQYLQLFSDNLSENKFTVYANMVDSENDKVVISESNPFTQAQLNMTTLVSEENYSYNFYGSKMYAMVNRNTNVPNDIEKYYPIKKIEDYSSDDSLSYETKQLISNMKTGDTYRARFYVQIKGETYFMAVAEAGESNISNLYTFAYNEETEKYSFTYKNDLILNATTPIANIDEYYLNVGTDYYKVNYYEYLDDAGSVYINPYVSRGSVETNTCDFEYAGTTKRIYFNYNDKTFYETFNFDNKVTTKTLGVEEFKVYTPVNSNYSVNIGLKSDDAQKWSYIGVNINSLPSPNIGFWYNNNTYGYVGYIAFTDADISYIASTTAENMFNYTTPEFGGTRHKNERIIDVLNDYIKALYEDTGAYSPEIIKLMKEKVTAYCNDYQPKGNIFKSLITVGEFYTTYKNGVLVDNIVEGVCLLIPITFELNIEYTDPQTNKTTIINETITASVKYYINVVSDTTNIEGTIYAVPIYSRNVIEYTSKSVSVTGSNLKINTNNMNKIYFETLENMYAHFYNAKTGQYLKFAILSEEEYELVLKSNNYPDKLTYLLNDSRYSDINVFSEEYALDGTLKIDLSGYDNGTYYVIAYYEKDGSDYAIRTSDNFIKLDIENSVIKYSLI